MGKISSQYESSLLAHGLKIETPVSIGGKFSFNRPCAVGAHTKLMYSQLDCFSLVGEDVSLLGALVGRYSTIQNNVQLSSLNQDSSVALMSPFFHKNPVFSYSFNQVLPPIEQFTALKQENQQPLTGESKAQGQDQSQGKGKVLISTLKNAILSSFPCAPLDQDPQLIKVGHDVWIGAYACINQPVTIGHGAIIKSGAVITKDVPDYAIVEGYDEVTGFRFGDEVRESLLEIQWWQYNLPEMLKQGQQVPVTDPVALVQFFKDSDPAQLVPLKDHWLTLQQE